MRFAYLSTDPGVPLGGARGSSVHVDAVVTALRGLGHEVRVFSPHAGVRLDGFAGLATELIAEDVAEPPLAKELGRLLYAERAVTKLLRELAEFEPDVVYERSSLFGYTGVQLAAALGAPLLLEVNAPLAREQERHRELVLRRTAGELERRVLAAADAVLAVSTAVADFARDAGVPDERLVVLRNGVDPARFHPSVPSAPTRRELGLAGARVVGFVGSLRPWHDVTTLRDAAALLHERDARTRLLVVGDGPGASAVARGRWVLHAGSVPHDDVPRYLAAMDVVAVPYAADEAYFSPLKLFEAMAMAKPVVGARVGQVAETIQDGLNGLLYEPGSADDLADKLATVLKDAAFAARIGAAAREHVAREHTWEQNAREIARLAASLVRRTARRTLEVA
jgi:glycosyltransferase involved in cell wall biosynthesis